MFSKSRGMWGSVGKSKNVHSLDHLRSQHAILVRHAIVTEQNSSLLVETLRSMSEILIWGDQNDSSVFDFFLEKNMLLFFLRILRQKTGRYICVQLLQTLNILFENIRNETSLYYLLSNNHVNAIIVHKFDFSDEEVLAYYISFLKTLSFKLNVHTIHFFYNEHTNDFALYTEAIKFFNHSESMVRIAVRTLTLNVYKVKDHAMLMYIRNKTAVPYFSNLVWFIGKHVLELHSAVKNDINHQSRNRLASLVAEHLDHLHYLNDILGISNEFLNDVLTDHLLNRLLIPLYVDSLTRKRASWLGEDHPHIGSVLSLSLLSQVFLIIKHSPIVSNLAKIIFTATEETLVTFPTDTSGITDMAIRGFIAPTESLERSLDNNRDMDLWSIKRRPNYRNVDSPTDELEEDEDVDEDQSSHEEQPDTSGAAAAIPPPPPPPPRLPPTSLPVSQSSVTTLDSNSTDEEKSFLAHLQRSELNIANRPYFAAILDSLDCTNGDHRALLALCLLYAIGNSDYVQQCLLESVCLTNRSSNKAFYNTILAEKLIALMNQSCQPNSLIRPSTLEMACLILMQLVTTEEGTCFLEDRHLACVEGAKEESVLLLRNYYKGDELFLDMFDDEYQSMKKRPMNVEYLMMDESIVLRPTGTPLTGIEFIKRLPSGEIERTRRAIRTFFLLRDLSLSLRKEEETKLPLTKDNQLVQMNDKLDLNNSDLIACTVVNKDKSPQRTRRFLVITMHQLVLVEPDSRKLGWGVTRFTGPLQDLEVTGDKDDSRSLNVTIHKRSAASPHDTSVPLLNARFQFDDHIRCMAAKQRLTKGRQKTRQAQMMCIADLLEIPLPSGNFNSALSSHPGMAMPVRQQMRRSATEEPSTSQAYRDSPSPPSTRHGRRSDSPARTQTTGQSHRTSSPQPIRGLKQSSSRRRRSHTPSASSPEVEQAHEALPLSAYQNDSKTFQQLKQGHTRERASSLHEGALPPSLMPPKEPPVSLLAATGINKVGKDSPKLLPPSSQERLRSLTNVSSDSDSSLNQSEYAERLQMPPFMYDTKGPAQVDVNPLSVSPSSHETESVMQSAKESLRKLSQSHSEDASSGDPDSIELDTIKKSVDFDGH